MEFIRPIVEERSAKMKEFGDDWDDAPVRQPSYSISSYYVIHAMEAQNDMLMWLMSEAKGVERSLEGWARRLLMLNFASVHSTSLVSCRSCLFLATVSSIANYASTQTFTQTLYRLLAHPEYLEPLRQEVEAVVAEEGWTKTGMDKMHKIDSFVRETQRIDGPIICQSTPSPFSESYVAYLLTASLSIAHVV
jgi:cytochrome P450